VADRPLVVAVGGDGTVRDAAVAVASAGIPLAVVPAGTGNVLAGALRFGSVAAALRVLEDGTPRRLDMGVATLADGARGADAGAERPFLVAAGTGFDARIMAAASGEWKRRLRFTAYIAAALQEVTRLQPAHFAIDADDRHLELDGLLVLIANCGDLIPGRLGARHPIDPTDGRLDLIAVGGSHLFDGLRAVVEVLWRTGALEGAVIRRPIEHVRVVSTPAQPIQTDGDPHPAGTLEAWVRPSALTVLVPRD
jgi:diacylglycerol kinase (ATP)